MPAESSRSPRGGAETWLPALSRVMARVNGAATGPGIFDALAQGLVQEFGIAMAAVWVFDPAADALQLRATAGVPGYHERAPSSLPPRDLSATIVRVAMTGASEVIDEIGSGHGFKDPAWLRREGIRAYAGLPLMLGDRGCGAMSVFYREPWPAGLLDALRVLSQQAALAIEHARLIEESQMLQAIAAEVAATRDPGELLAGLVRRVRAALGADACGVWLLDERRGTLPIAASDGFSKRFLRIISLPEAEPISPMFDEIRQTGRPLYTRDDQAEARARDVEFAAVFASEGVVSALRLPLFQPGGGVVGLLGLYHRHERLYTDSEVRAAQAFTDQIAVALHNARLAQKEREAQAVAKRQVDRLGALTRVTEQLLASSNVDGVVRVLAKAAVELSSATGAVVALVRPGERMLELTATYGDFQSWFDSFPETNLDIADLSRWATGRAIRTGQTVFVPDYLKEPMERSVQLQSMQAGLRALIAAPLRKGDALLGMIWVGHKKAGGLTAEDALLLDALAEQGALALEQARVMEESHTLQVIAAELASTRETSALLKGIAERSMAALSPDGGSVWLLDDEQQRPILAAAAGLSRRFFEAVQAVMVDDPQTGAALYEMARSTQEPAYFADDVGTVRGISERMANEFASEGIVSSLRLPLTDPAGVVVGMVVLHHRRERLYSDSELRLAQAFTDQIAVALYNAHLAEKERGAQAVAKRQLERLQTITRITERLLAATEFSTVLRVVVEAAGRLCDASGAIVGLIDDEGKRLSAVAGEGEPRRYFEQFTTPILDESFLAYTATGQALAQRAPVVVEDYAAWPTRHWSQQETVNLGVRAFVVAPLLVGGMPIGALWVNDVKPRSFQPEDVALVQALADQAALAIQHARLVQRGQDAAVLEERTRLARDLHDSVTQSVFSLGMMARAAQTQYDRGSDRLAATLERIAALSQEALREMRALLFELQPIALAEEGLAGALERLAEAVRTRLDLEVDFRGADCRRLAADVETAIFRIVQEALANATKHAQATGIAITLEEQDGHLHVCVQDNGVGFNPEAPVVESADGRRGGMGMRTMQERAAAAGLQIRIHSRPGEGTSVTIEAVLPGEVAASA